MHRLLFGINIGLCDRLYWPFALFYRVDTIITLRFGIITALGGLEGFTMTKKLFCFLSSFVLLVSSASAIDNLSLLNDKLTKRSVFEVQNALGIELSDYEIPRKFLVTSYGFLSESRRILSFLDLLEKNKDRAACIRAIEQVNEIFSLQFVQFVKHHKKFDQAEKLQVLSAIEKLHTTIGLTNAAFARMVIGLFQVRVGSWNYEDKLGMMAVVLERARREFLANELRNDELRVFVGFLEEMFIEKPRGLPWKTIGRVFLVTTVLAGLGYAAYKMYSWSKNKVVPVVGKLGDDIRQSSENLKEGMTEVVRDGMIGALEDTKKFVKDTLPEQVKEVTKEVVLQTKQEVNDLVDKKAQEVLDKAPEAVANALWRGIGAFVSSPLKKAFNGVKYYTYDQWDEDSDEEVDIHEESYWF